MKLDPDTATSIELTRAEALVLHDWLSRHEDTGTTPGKDAEQTALNGLNAALERTLVEPFQADYVFRRILRTARVPTTVCFRTVRHRPVPLTWRASITASSESLES